MIKPRRIGHATFETPDLEKAIAYYEKFMGLIVAEREKDRAFLATKIGQLVIQLNKVGPRALHQAVVRGGAEFRFRRAGAASLPRTACAASCATTPFPAWARCCRSRTTRAPPSSCSRSGTISASTSRLPASARSSSGTSPSTRPDIQRTVEFYEKVLGFRVSDWIGDFFVLHALQPRPSHRELLHRAGREAASHRVRAEGFHASAELVRADGPEEDADHLGPAAARPRPQHRHLSPQSGSSRWSSSSASSTR